MYRSDTVICSLLSLGFLKDLVQQRLGFPRFRLSLLLENGSWEELLRPREVQVVFNQTATEHSEALLSAIYQEDEDAVREVLQPLGSALIL